MFTRARVYLIMVYESTFEFIFKKNTFFFRFYKYIFNCGYIVITYVTISLLLFWLRIFDLPNFGETIFGEGN